MSEHEHTMQSLAERRRYGGEKMRPRLIRQLCEFEQTRGRAFWANAQGWERFSDDELLLAAEARKLPI